VSARSFSAGLLLALLWPNAPDQAARLQHLTPLTMEPVGSALKLYPDDYGFAPFVRSGGQFVLKTRTQVQVIDATSLRVLHTYPFKARVVCAVGLDGDTVVVLSGCRNSTSRTFRLWRIASTSRRSLPVRGLPPVSWPVSFALGDGTWFVARGNGDVDAIDLRTGNVAFHHRARLLQKAGVPYTNATWLGEHRLGLNGTVVDVRTWKRTTLALGARNLLAAEGKIVGWGTNGITVYDDDLHLYRRIARGLPVDSVGLLDGVIYAQVGLAWDLWNVRTGRHLATVLPDTPYLVRLL